MSKRTAQAADPGDPMEACAVTSQATEFPPVQHLVLDVLAARWRTGERMWTFPARIRPALVVLELRGLIGWKHGVVQGTCQAWLTEQGRGVALSPTYSPPSETLHPRHCRHGATHPGHEYERVLGDDDGHLPRVALYWCPGVAHDHSQLCCAEHGHHVTPHRGCILR